MMLKVYKNDVTDWVIAESPADASAVCATHQGEPEDDDWGQRNWVELPDDQPLSILDEDEGHTTKTCAEWIASNGRGFLASTEF